MDLVRLSLSGLCSELLGYIERAFRQEITLTPFVHQHFQLFGGIISSAHSTLDIATKIIYHMEWNSAPCTAFHGIGCSSYPLFCYLFVVYCRVITEMTRKTLACQGFSLNWCSQYCETVIMRYPRRGLFFLCHYQIPKAKLICLYYQRGNQCYFKILV